MKLYLYLIVGILLSVISYSIEINPVKFIPSGTYEIIENSGFTSLFNHIFTYNANGTVTWCATMSDTNLSDIKNKLQDNNFDLKSTISFYRNTIIKESDAAIEFTKLDGTVIDYSKGTGRTYLGSNNFNAKLCIDLNPLTDLWAKLGDNSTTVVIGVTPIIRGRGENISAESTPTNHTHLTVINSSMLLYYPFNHDIEKGVWRSGVINNSLIFKDKNKYVTVRNKPEFNFTQSGELSISLWLKLDNNATPTNQWVISKYSSGTTGQFFMYVTPVNGVVSFFVLNSSGITHYVANLTGIRNLAWHHIAVSASNRTQTMQLYFDGVLYQNTSFPTLDSIRDYNSNIIIGKDVAGSIFLFNGTMDETMIYKDILTPDEVLGIYNSQRAGLYNASIPTDNMVLDLRLDETGGSFAEDSSGLSNHGALVGYDTKAKDYSKYNFDGTFTNGAYETYKGPNPNFNDSYAGFDGFDDYVAAQYPALKNITTNFTLSVWANITNQYFASDLEGAIVAFDSRKFGIQVGGPTSGNLGYGFYLCNSTTNNVQMTLTSKPVPFGTWQMITGVYDGNNITLFCEVGYASIIGISCSIRETCLKR